MNLELHSSDVEVVLPTDQEKAEAFGYVNDPGHEISIPSQQAAA